VRADPKTYGLRPRLWLLHPCILRDYKIHIYLRYQNLLVVISVTMEDHFRRDQEGEEGEEEGRLRSWIPPSIHPG